MSRKYWRLFGDLYQNSLKQISLFYFSKNIQIAEYQNQTNQNKPLLFNPV